MVHGDGLQGAALLRTWLGQGSDFRGGYSVQRSGVAGTVAVLGLENGSRTEKCILSVWRLTADRSIVSPISGIDSHPLRRKMREPHSFQPLIGGRKAGDPARQLLNHLLITFVVLSDLNPLGRVRCPDDEADLIETKTVSLVCKRLCHFTPSKAA